MQKKDKEKYVRLLLHTTRHPLGKKRPSILQENHKNSLSRYRIYLVAVKSTEKAGIPSVFFDRRGEGVKDEGMSELKVITSLPELLELL